MDPFSGLLLGFEQVLEPTNLLFALLGCVLGMLVGILPGFGPPAATALLLPVTFVIGPIPGIIMMAAIFYGSAYGGTITAVLLNIPGEPSSVATMLDGHPMAKQGRGGQALVIAAVGSFIGGLIATIGMVFAAPIATAALAFGPREYFGLTIFALSLVVGLSGKSVVKGLLSAVIGLSIGIIGLDPVLGTPRFTGGMPILFDGISLAALVMGLFGLSEMLIGLEERLSKGKVTTIGRIAPTRQDWQRSIGPIGRGSIIGFFTGLLPGNPGTASAFGSYALEKRLSKHKNEFGKGAVEGVAGPETANNSLNVATMIPMFVLGVPSSVTMAILMGAFIMHGLTPGPLLFRDNPDVAWAIIASLFVGNVILLIMNVPLIRVWLFVLRVPYPILFAVVVGLMAVGAYIVDNAPINILVLVIAGVLGYIMRKLDMPLAPIALTMVLGSMIETNLVRSLLLADGDVATFAHSPLALAFLIAAALVLVAPPLLKIVRKSTTPHDRPDTHEGSTVKEARMENHS
ncbi:tripartite tricarboxylate transporter permease [Cellulosimicrobium funkei]|nr:tripartite tricarboxylate transporter permease [Cellulosimicrobium funkei]